MKTTIDAAGRLVIPKEIRREANLRPGDALEIRCREGKVELEPAPLTVRLERRGQLVVAVPTRPAGVLSRETVKATRQAVRRRTTRRSRE